MWLPHPLGVHGTPGIPIQTVLGSSPQARGGRKLKPYRPSDQRLIPAGAGRIFGPAHSIPARAAHPRRRGEDRTWYQFGAGLMGSSPQARGGLCCWVCVNSGDGLIPASAGRTSFRHTGQETPPAHPRRRGEDWSIHVFRAARRGSSPRARGGQSEFRDGGTAQRLIPASAGRTSYHPNPARSYWAHPRERGEDLADALVAVVN